MVHNDANMHVNVRGTHYYRIHVSSGLNNALQVCVLYHCSVFKCVARHFEDCRQVVTNGDAPICGMLPARPSNFHCVTHTMLHLFTGLTLCVLLSGSTVIRCRFEEVNLLEKSYLFSHLHEFLFWLHFFIVLHLVHSMFISCLVNGGFNPHGCYYRVAVITDCGWSTCSKAER